MTIDDYDAILKLATDKVDDVAKLLDDEKLSAYCATVRNLERWRSWLMGYYSALDTLQLYSEENVTEFNEYREEANEFALVLICTLKELDLI